MAGPIGATATLREMTQAFIAMAVVIAALSICALLIIRGNYVEAAMQLLSNAFFLIVGFYFRAAADKKKPDDGDST